MRHIYALLRPLRVSIGSIAETLSDTDSGLPTVRSCGVGGWSLLSSSNRLDGRSLTLTRRELAHLLYSCSTRLLLHGPLCERQVESHVCASQVMMEVDLLTIAMIDLVEA